MMIPKTQFVIPAISATYPIYPQMFGQQMLTQKPGSHHARLGCPGAGDIAEILDTIDTWRSLGGQEGSLGPAPGMGSPSPNLGFVPAALRTSMSLLGALYTSCPGRSGLVRLGVP